MTHDPWLLFEADGRFHQVHALHGAAPHNPDGLEAVRVTRHTTDPECEHYDRKRRMWVLDEERRAEVDERTRIADLTAPEVYAELKQRIDALEAEVAALKAR